MKLSLFVCVLISIKLLAQREDYNWLVGYRGINSGIDSNISVSLINFKDESMNINKIPALIYLYQTNSIISNNTGDRILLASNGFQVYDASLMKIFPDFMINIGSLQWSESEGNSLRQGTLTLAMPGSDSLYMLLYLWQDCPTADSFVQTNKLYHAIVNINKNLGLGELISKDQLILAAPFEYGKITSCRHANGRDWWIIIPKRYSKEVYIFLLDIKYPYDEVHLADQLCLSRSS